MIISPADLTPLVTAHAITEEDLATCVAEAEQGTQDLGLVLVKKCGIKSDQLGEIVAQAHGYKFKPAKNITIDPAVLNLIPEIAAKSYKMVAFELDTTQKILRVMTPDPENEDAINTLQKKTAYILEPYYCTPSSFEDLLALYRSDLALKVKTLIAELKADPLKESNIISLVDAFMEYAYDNRASDIHIEPQKNRVIVRFRIDGMMHEVASYEKELHEKIISRLKIMSRLRTDEHGAPQDGRFLFESGTITFDVRISIVPVTDGENAVMRLLTDRYDDFGLESLGFSPENLEKVQRAIAKAYGMILAVGPTGSGKTTTLYAILQQLNKPEVHIMTIEDPVEYDMDHIQQIQANPKKDLTFANGLRSIVRQDPNVIMVGEIRDEETAGIAVSAAMTGHVLLSTLHANDAPTAFPRLMELHVEPFLVASALNLVVAVRLVRKICPQCKTEYRLSPEEIALLSHEKKLLTHLLEYGNQTDIAHVPFYKGAGCPACSMTGYKGRIGIMEVLEVTNELRPLITQKSSADVIAAQAVKDGMISLLGDGAMKAVKGETTLSEIIRTTST
ncbi:MAG: GspE/PulE family protein [bacterium]|nr:GspE/PulE family protein [bacterium]